MKHLFVTAWVRRRTCSGAVLYDFDLRRATYTAGGWIRRWRCDNAGNRTTSITAGYPIKHVLRPTTKCSTFYHRPVLNAAVEAWHERKHFDLFR
jgi:hypothetical protein